MNLSVLGQTPTLEELAAMVGPAPSNSPTPAWERALVSLGQSLGGHINSTPFMQVADSGDWAGAGKTAADILMRDVLGRDPETGEQGLPGVGLAGMTVFHGSPHKWMPEPGFPQGRPRLDKIGTGEGAQAYGHGVYFAESPGVARDYQTRLSAETPSTYIGDRQVIKDPSVNRGEAIAHGVYQMERGDAQKALERLQRLIARGDLREQGPAYQEAAELLQNNMNSIRRETPGSLYTIDLPDEIVPDMLDYDLPLTSQPSVLRAVSSLFGEPIPNHIGYVKDRAGVTRDIGSRKGGDIIRDLQADLLRTPADSAHIAAVQDFISNQKDPVAGLRSAYPDITDAELDAALPPMWRMQQAGVPGVRYLDGMSREGGGETRNAVVWDQDWLDRMQILGVE